MGGVPNYLVFYNSAYRDDCVRKYASIKCARIYKAAQKFDSTFCCNINTTDLSRQIHTEILRFDKSHQRSSAELRREDAITRVSLSDDTFHRCDAA